MGNKLAGDTGKSLLTAVLKKPGSNIKKLFLSYDTDGNETLDLAEFRKFYAELEKILDKQGWKDEANANSTDVAADVFQLVDQDKNGTISYHEFKAFIATISMAYNLGAAMNDW